MNDYLDRYRVVPLTPIDVELDLADYRTFVRSQPDSRPKRTQSEIAAQLVVAPCPVFRCRHDSPCPVHPA